MKQVKIRTRLKPTDINLKGAENLIGKEVEIIINEIKPNEPNRVWKHAGALNLKGKFDSLNIRDVAHD